MKKNFLIVLVIVIVLCLGLFINFKNNKEDKFLKDGFQEIYEIKKGLKIYSKKDIYFKSTSLKDAFDKKLITYDNLLSYLDANGYGNDGGSKYYKYNKDKKDFGDKEFYLVKCNSISSNNYNVYIDYDEANILNVCNE